MKKLFIACALTLGMIISASPVINKYFDLSEEITGFLSRKKTKYSNYSNRFVLTKTFEEVVEENPDKIKKFKLDEDIEKIFKYNIIWALTNALCDPDLLRAIAREIRSNISLDSIIETLKKISKTDFDLTIPQKAIQEAANEFLKQLNTLTIKDALRSSITEKKQFSMNKTCTRQSCQICGTPIHKRQAWSDTGHYYNGPVHDACLFGRRDLLYICDGGCGQTNDNYYVRYCENCTKNLIKNRQYSSKL